MNEGILSLAVKVFVGRCSIIVMMPDRLTTPSAL